MPWNSGVLFPRYCALCGVQLQAGEPDWEGCLGCAGAWPDLRAPLGRIWVEERVFGLAGCAGFRLRGHPALRRRIYGMKYGGERGWAHERVLNATTIREWTNAPRLPLFMTATCELARYDDPEVETAGDDMLLNSEGGAVAMLTTTRVVFSGSNQQLNRAFYACAFDDSPERPLRLGDIARRTKNDPQVSNSSNKRNFSLLGDAAMRLAYPELRVVFTEVPDTLRALDVDGLSPREALALLAKWKEQAGG